MPSLPPSERVSVPSILQTKARTGRKLVALTAYDFTSAKLIDAAGVDVILVGDSLGSVIQGLETTLPVTLEEVIYHSRCVTRAARRALVVGDLPFLSYQVSIERAIESAGRLLKEGGVSAVKLEGGLAMSETIRRIVELDIPVMGHVGLTPQSFHRMGGHKVQGRQSGSSEIAGTRERVLEDALAVERAGAFACVLEGIPADLGREITAALAIPTIGIGAGADCDGQILVSTDLLGMSTEPSPKFVKRYAELAETITSAVATYAAEVRDGAFPGDEHSFRGNGAGTAKPSKLKLAK